MAAPFNIDLATADQRAAIIEYAAASRARMRSAERADRPTAEAAIRDLYARAKLQPPSIEWRDSPVAAAAAARFADTGSSAGHPSILAQRFRLDPRWVRSTLGRLGDTPDYEHFRQAAHQPFRRLLALDAASAGISRALDGRVRLPLASWPSTAGKTPDPADVDAAGRLAFGDEWARIVPILGREQAALMISTAVRRHADAVARGVLGLVPLALGQLDSFHPYVAAGRDVLGLRLARHRLEHVDTFLAIASSAGPWFPLRGVVFASERPLVCEVDSESRLHAEDGPALAYGDGVTIHAWHGVRVPPEVILQPESIELDGILAEPNAEIRRVLTERFGIERFVRAPGSQLVHEDETGKLWRRWITTPRRWGGGGDVVQMVEVVNSTPEPDGTRRTYFLRVPPTIQTARAAVAWTFQLQPWDYRPSVET